MNPLSRAGISFLLVLTCGLQSLAQVLYGDFEEWDSTTLWMNPANWSSLNPIHALLFGYEEFTVSRTEDPYSGRYGLQVQTKYYCVNDSSELCFLVPGIAFLGEIFVSPSDLSVLSFGEEYHDRPEALTGWFRYDPAPGDSMYILVELSRQNPDVMQRETIARGEFTAGGDEFLGQYHPLNIVLTYFSTATPEKVRIYVHSGLQEGPFEGTYDHESTLELDFLNLGDAYLPPLGIEDYGTVMLQTYPNPATTHLNIRLEANSNAEVSLKAWSMSGQLMHKQDMFLQSQHVQLDLGNWPEGIYLVSLEDEQNNLVIHREKVVVIR